MHRTISIALFGFTLLFAPCGDGIDIVDSPDDMAGSGNVITAQRTVSGFDQIALAGEGNVIVSAGPVGLTIQTDDNLLEYIETTVEDRTLEIRTEPGIDIDPTESVIYRISTPELYGVTLSGAGSFDISDWSAEMFTIMLSGAGDIEMPGLTATDLDVTISGVGEVSLDGAVGDLDVAIPGAGSFAGEDLQSTTAVVTTSGAGSATVWATDALEATVSGVGSINYYGEPIVTQSVTGVGSINDKGPK